MLKQEGVTLGGIRVEPVSDRTPVPNAYLSGLGRGAQLVVTDTLLDAFTVEESLFVVGHELSHSLLGHLWWDLALSVTGGAVGLFLLIRIMRWCIGRSTPRLGYDSLSHPASLPLAYLVVASLALLTKLPANSASRYFEAAADRHGMAMAARAGATVEDAVSVMRKLGSSAFSDPEPPPSALLLFWPHPPLAERVANLRALEREDVFRRGNERVPLIREGH